jgi:opacity protein-like surface antigen
VKGAAALVLILIASPALAQHMDLTALGGYTTTANIDEKTRGIEELAVKGSFTWGLALGRAFTDHLGAEISWAQQRSALRIGTAAGSADLFDMQIGRLHGNIVYRFGGDAARLKPFVFGGLGAAFLSARDLDTETKLSWGLGAGLKWTPSRNWGARVQARYTQIQLNDSSADVCDPFGFCQGSFHQVEVLGGLALRF